MMTMMNIVYQYKLDLIEEFLSQIVLNKQTQWNLVFYHFNEMLYYKLHDQVQ